MRSEKNIVSTILALNNYLDQGQHDLGEKVVRDDILSSAGPFSALPDYVVKYPKVVVDALSEIYQEYNQQFVDLVEKNREGETDYQYNFINGTTVNRWVQVDMVGLPESFLQVASVFAVKDVKEVLRLGIYEIENSLAMYQLLERITGNNQFKEVFRASLNSLRQQYGKPIALLAVTEDKYQAMLHDEFGWDSVEKIPAEKVKELSGFDYFFAPDEFEQHVKENDSSHYLLYVRSSDPVTKLKNPKVQINHPLLSDPKMRSIIKSNSVTFNIDNPNLDSGLLRINDTKAYLSPMNMAYEVGAIEDVLSADLVKHTRSGKSFSDFKGEHLTGGFVQYLKSVGISSEDVVTGKVCFRAKPFQGTYGCYGHHVVNFGKRGDRSNLASDLKKRGRYVLQPEMPTPVIIDKRSGEAYAYIDRNFFCYIDNMPVFMGGFRTLLSTKSNEVKKGRLHGNGETVWAAIEQK